MPRKNRLALLMLLVVGCIEPYQFRIADTSGGIVIEATLSDKSFNDTRDYPSDGRYFTVTISRTSDVINVRPEMITGAYVRLVGDNGAEWIYQEAGDAGVYRLHDDTFKAMEGVRYKISVVTPDDIHIESDWESLPAGPPLIGQVGFRETSRPRVILGEVRVINGATAFMLLPANPTTATLYYRWKFSPTWIFEAPLGGTDTRTCWATSPYYLNNYVVHADHQGGYAKDLFVMDVPDNERILHELSVLIEQQSMSAEYYNYWKEMQELNLPGGVFAMPPFNLKTNYRASKGTVFGYFGVVREQATRWYFNRADLSYSVPSWLTDQCNEPCLPPGCPPPPCVSCLRYEGGHPQNTKPVWWGR